MTRTLLPCFALICADVLGCNGMSSLLIASGGTVDVEIRSDGKFKRGSWTQTDVGDGLLRIFVGRREHANVHGRFQFC